MIGLANAYRLHRAGISTESGIPDFRRWAASDPAPPIYFDDFMASDAPRVPRRKFATDETMQKAEPNAGHRALAKLVEQAR
jgi:NAD-dependent deacetylase